MTEQVCEPAQESFSHVSNVVVAYRAFVQALQLDCSHSNVNPASHGEEPDWLVACRTLTSRIERMGKDSALLDLGDCTSDEALSALDALRAHLRSLGLVTRAGVGPSSIVAQLARRFARVERPIVLVSPAQCHSFLGELPVRALLTLRPQGLIPLEVVERLERYGLRTLGHACRIDERALRRQFGAVGGILTAVLQGRDPLPFHVTPPPSVLRFRVSFAAPLTVDEALARLPTLAARITRHLRARGMIARFLRLDVQREDGPSERARLALHQTTLTSTLLTAELQRLFVSQTELKAAGASTVTVDEETSCRVESLYVTLGGLTAAVPTQTTFWRTREQQRAALTEVAYTLARRHGKALLFFPQIVTPAAIFSEERYALCDQWRTQRSWSNDGEGSDVTQQLLPTGTERARTARSRRSADPWQGVPQRLHWW